MMARRFRPSPSSPTRLIQTIETAGTDNRAHWAKTMPPNIAPTEEFYFEWVDWDRGIVDFGIRLREPAPIELFLDAHPQIRKQFNAWVAQSTAPATPAPGAQAEAQGDSGQKPPEPAEADVVRHAKDLQRKSPEELATLAGMHQVAVKHGNNRPRDRAVIEAELARLLAIDELAAAAS